MRISSVFQIPPDLDSEVDPRAIEHAKSYYEDLPTIRKIQFLMAHLFCVNKSIVDRNKERLIHHFIHTMALRNLLIPDVEAVRIVNQFEPYTKTYLLWFIWGTAPEVPPEVVEVIRREVIPTVRPVQVLMIDPKSIALAIGSLMLLV